MAGPPRLNIICGPAESSMRISRASPRNGCRRSRGRLSHLATIRRAIERGDAAFDFLRGDEPYKAHLRAVPRGTFEARAIPARRAARLRQTGLGGRRERRGVAEVRVAIGRASAGRVNERFCDANDRHF